MKNIYFLLFLFVFISCKNDSQKSEQPTVVTTAADYSAYLELDDHEQITQLQLDIDSLEIVVANNPIGVLDLGRLSSKLNTLYDLKGDVNNLNRSVEMQEAVVENMYIKPNNSKRELAQAYIKLHQFKKADSLMSSFAKQDLSRESQMIYFDIAMELGDYSRAEKMLNALKNSQDYNYLIRAAKWNDYKGDLSATIRLMEKAKTLADQSGNLSLQLWTNSNIADYYGHDGQIERSYEHYLKTLQLDPNDSYALKGIAWIVYSYEKNPNEALRILTALKKRHPLPDYDLAIAEIKEFQKQTEAAEELRQSFLEEVSNPAYGNMYNTYKIEQLVNGNNEEKQQALIIAKNEVENRSTPETQSLLSLAFLKNGMMNEALENQQKYVMDKTFEPVAQLHSLEILIENGKKQKALEYGNDLLEAEYELGPVTLNHIKQILSSI
ncbi:tetratricopeptide repeat protein [Nonlabens sp.]|uniref:tetratricopeptide repeat protein n=1 Tax=Nonlabens sp. TaxID=1888209 RepID=UPI003F6A4E37